jgi:molecular chaperone DnaK (HSP70)
MIVHGIDLGTTYSCIAYLDDAGRPTVIRNLDETDTLPSVVYFESSDNVVVGAAARDALRLDARNVKTRVKRDMGHPVAYEYWGRTYPPEEISALILRKLASDAAVNSGTEVKDAVITVPAYFGISERAATKRAGEQAGLNVVDVLSEPIAAAISYGALRQGVDRNVFVFDLGGGTFDATVISMRDGSIEVVCTDGDHDLGGADWDDALSEHLVEQFRAQHPDASDPATDEAAVAEIRLEAEQAKRRLSAATSQQVRIMHEGRVATVTVTREQLEELTGALLSRTIDITRRAVATARGKGVTSFDDVLLVGGSSKMPAVADRLAAELGAPPQLFDPDLAIAKGAALFAFEETYRRLLDRGATEQADQMIKEHAIDSANESRIRKAEVHTVASRSFGVAVFDEDGRHEFVDHLVHANDRLPAEKTEEYYTLEDNQTAVRIRVMEQAGAIESAELGDNRQIDEGKVSIPPGKRRGWPILVTYKLDRSGLLAVTAIERETGDQLDLQVQV